MTVLTVQLERLKGADVACDEGEDGHAEAALDEDAEEGQLQEARNLVLAVGGPEESASPCARYVCEYDEYGCETSHALRKRSGLAV